MKRIAVIGLGRFGYQVAVTLAEKGAEVIAIDKDPAKIEEIKDRVSLAVTLDSTDVEALKAQGIDNVEVAVVCMGEDFEAALLTAVTLKEIGVKEVIARTNTAIRGEILRRVGVDGVVFPDDEMGKRLAQNLLYPTVVNSIPLSEGYSIAQLKVPPEFHGKKLSELDLRRRFGINVVAIMKKGGEIDNVPPPEYVLGEGDTLVLIGPNTSIEKLGKK